MPDPVLDPKTILNQAKPILNDLFKCDHFITTSSMTTQESYKFALLFILPPNYPSGMLKLFFRTYGKQHGLSIRVKRGNVPTVEGNNTRSVEIVGLKSALKLDEEAALEELVGLMNQVYKNDQDGDAFQVPLLGSGYLQTFKVPMVPRQSTPLVETLGQGNASTVYSYHFNDQPAALKEFSSDCLGVYDEELEIHQLFDHPSIIKLLGMIDEPNYKALILEQGTKGTLHTYLIDHKDEARNYLILNQAILNITLALAYIHQFRIIHGDISAKNIVFDAAMNAKLIDFSISGWLEDGKDKLICISKIGSPRWAGPECWNFVRTLKFDIYAIGLLLWVINTNAEISSENICGNENPFIDGKIGNHLPVLPNRISDSTKATIYQCWNRKPDLRPSAVEVANVLKISHQGIQKC